MGDRRDVKMTLQTDDPPIYFYTHFGGKDLPETVRSILDKPEVRHRWDDPPYLARIIFCGMIKSSCIKEKGIRDLPETIEASVVPILNFKIFDGTTGFGISLHKARDAEYPPVEIYCPAQTVTIFEYTTSFDEFTQMESALWQMKMSDIYEQVSGS